MQVRMEGCRLETLATPGLSPGMAREDHRDSHPHLSQRQAGDLLVGGGELPQTSLPEPREPNTLSPEGRASCDYSPTPSCPETGQEGSVVGSARAESTWAQRPPGPFSPGNSDGLEARNLKDRTT